MKRANYLLSILMIILASFVYYYAGRFVGLGGSDLGPSFFPRMVSIFIYILSVLLIIVTLTTHKVDKQSLFNKNGFLRVLSGAILILFYFILIKGIGFIFSTIVFLVVFMKLLGIRIWIKSILISITTTLIVYYLFQDILKVRLPSGLWI